MLPGKGCGWEGWQSCSLASPSSLWKMLWNWSDRVLPIAKGFASSGPDCSARPGMLRTSFQLSGRAGSTRQFLSGGSAAFPRQERGCRASPGHSPSLGVLGECRTCQDLPAPLAESGSHLINRFQTLPATEASVSVFLLPSPPLSSTPA